MEALSIVLAIIIGIPIVIWLGMAGFAFLIIGGRIISNLAPMILGIVWGVKTSNAGHVALGVIIILASIVLGFKWIGFLEEKFWEKKMGPW